MGGGFKHSIKGKRNKNDFYPTHHSMVWQLMEQLKIPEDHVICDPAAGENDIVIALRESGMDNLILWSDISTGNDFLLDENSYDVIFTNPPFSIANVFLEKAFQVAKESIIFLLPLDYLHGQERYETFYRVQKKFFLAEIHMFVRRPMFTDSVRKDGCYGTGSVTFAWFVWKKMELGFEEPKLKWIDNSLYTLGSTKKQLIEEQMLMEF